MKITSIDLDHYRNYESLHLECTDGTHVIFGDNGQGKSALLEAMYLSCTNKSYRGAKDRELIEFDHEESHIRMFAEKKGNVYRVDMHLKGGKNKGIALNGVPVRRAREFIGLFPAVIFSPQDLQIIKDGPQERRRFLDTECCLLSGVYANAYIQYKKALEQRNKLLKDMAHTPELFETLDVWDESLVRCGKTLITLREAFIRDIRGLAREVHEKLTGGREVLDIRYEPSVAAEKFEEALKKAREKDFYQKTTTVGPHRDDIGFDITDQNGNKTPIDARIYGSQGQQRTAALSLKMAEIELVKQKTNDDPVLFLDDVLSELDANRQKFLLESIKGIQTFITCTGLDDFIKKHMELSRVYSVANGVITHDK